MASADTSPARKSWYLDDWWTPILVKEVRQALRGKYFKICFWIVLLAVVVATAGMMIGMQQPDGSIVGGDGRAFFFGIFLCLSIAVLGFVPFSAFNAMGAEWDENTFDLLIISNLKPRQIVLGKLLATSVQTLLFYSTFTPFLVFSSLLQGVDLLSVWVVLIGALIFSTVLSLVAICLSTVSRVRFARIVLMAMLAAVLVFATFGGSLTGSLLITSPGAMRDPQFLVAATMMLLGAIILGVYCFAIACNMLAHPEENRSTGVRVITTVTILAALWWMQYMASVIGQREFLSGIAIGLIVFLLVPGTFFVTEPEILGRRVTPRVSKNPLLALLSIPFLPGGGRGLVLFVGQLLTVVLFALWMHGEEARIAGEPLLTDGVPGILAAALYAFVYVALPSSVLAPFTDRPVLRAAARAVVPFMIATFAFVPAVVGAFLGDRTLTNMEHPGNPFFLIYRTWNGDYTAQPGAWFTLIGLVAVAVVLNAYRVVVGVRQVIDASRARAQRERAQRQESLPPPTGVPPQESPSDALA